LFNVVVEVLFLVGIVGFVGFVVFMLGTLMVVWWMDCCFGIFVVVLFALRFVVS